MTTTPPEYRVDPDNPARVVRRVGQRSHSGKVLWDDPWTAMYLHDEDVEGWTRLVPAPPVEHRCDIPAPVPQEWACECGKVWTLTSPAQTAASDG